MKVIMLLSYVSYVMFMKLRVMQQQVCFEQVSIILPFRIREFVGQ